MDEWMTEYGIGFIFIPLHTGENYPLTVYEAATRHGAVKVVDRMLLVEISQGQEQEHYPILLGKDKGKSQRSFSLDCFEL